ncbi:MAG: flavin reductase [Campylobacteraceae bacterium 4484_4]|nr:MAG: flavin reductase [Campylobacteraceae bacterium 4484_4]
MLIVYRNTTPAENYKLMSQSIIPRPIAWIVTEDEGVVNVAPFSYFTGLSSNPPTVIVSVGHKSDGSPKDTLRNLRKRGRCTLCLVDEAHLEAMHLSSKEMAAERSEAEAFGIGLQNVMEEYPPMISGVPIAFFCTLYQEIDLKGSKTIPLILKIEAQYVDERVMQDKEAMKIVWRPVARVGKSYARIGEEIAAPKIP